MASPANFDKSDEKDDTVNLNVGGCLYTTTRSTLTRYPDTMLAAMFSGELDPSVCDDNGAYVIDGDGPIFRHVLNFLRRGKLNLPEDFKEWDLLASEADFYQIEGLIYAVKGEKCRKVGPKDMKKIQKIEFIEIEKWDECKYLDVKYIGSSETLANLPALLEMFKSSKYGSLVLDVVKREGKIRHGKPMSSQEAYIDKRISIFQEALIHEFKLHDIRRGELKAVPSTVFTFIREI